MRLQGRLGREGDLRCRVLRRADETSLRIERLNYVSTTSCGNNSEPALRRSPVPPGHLGLVASEAAAVQRTTQRRVRPRHGVGAHHGARAHGDRGVARPRGRAVHAMWARSAALGGSRTCPPRGGHNGQGDVTIVVQQPRAIYFALCTRPTLRYVPDITSRASAPCPCKWARLGNQRMAKSKWPRLVKMENGKGAVTEKPGKRLVELPNRPHRPQGSEIRPRHAPAWPAFDAIGHPAAPARCGSATRPASCRPVAGSRSG